MIKNIVAENLFLEVIECLLSSQALFRLVLGIAFDHFFLQSIDSRVTRALFLTRSVQGCPQTLGVIAFDLADHFFVQHGWFDRPLLNLQGLVEFFLPATEAVDFLVRKHQCLNHDRLRYFLSAGFDHHDRFFGAGHNQIQL